MTVSIIAAVDRNLLIGSNGEIPWLGLVPEDLKRFRELTLGHSVIMGRKTYESLPDAVRPLPDRHNIVLTLKLGYSASGCTVVNDFGSALDAAESDEVFVIGGGQVYEQALFLANRIYLTEVEGEFRGETFFPNLEWDKWCITAREDVPAKPPSYGCRLLVLDLKREQPCPEIVIEPQVDPRYAKSPGYAADLEDILAQGVCPFCPENFNWHPNPILRKLGRWIITQNRQPYENTKHHFLLKGDEHKESLAELTPLDWVSMRGLISWAMEEFKFEGGGLAIRFGPSNYTGATVRHLHAHLIVPELDPKTNQAIAVSFPFG